MGNKKKQSKKAGNEKNKKMVLILIIAALAAFVVYSVINSDQEQQAALSDSGNPPVAEVKSDTDGTQINLDIPTDVDLKIIKSEISDKAKFYPYKSGGTYMEVIAVEATDGSIRTALNTCQVCFTSGRGYYIQRGDKLVCQNCGNVFGADDIEVVRGGCNPVPVLAKNKTDDGENIIINREYLENSKDYFANWKR